MRSKSMLIGSVLLSSALLVTGCAKPPQAELDALNAAMTAAEQAQAETYAQSELATARDAVNAAKAEIEKQNQKFALFRSYKNALAMITDASGKAKAAQDAAVANKAKAKQEAETATQAAKDAVTQAQTAMTELEGCKRKPKGFAADMTVLKGTLDGLVTALGGLDSALSSEDYNGAKSQAESISSQAATLLTDLQGAKAKIKC